MTPKELYTWAVKNHAENAECFTERDDYEYDVTFTQPLAGAGFDESTKRAILCLGRGKCAPIDWSDITEIRELKYDDTQDL